MKKIYAIAALFLAASTSYGQRNIDLSVTLTSPAEGATVPKNSAQAVNFTFKHSGSPMVEGDVILLFFTNFDTDSVYSLTGLNGYVSTVEVDQSNIAIINSGNPVNIPGSVLNTNRPEFSVGDEIGLVVTMELIDTDPGQESNPANNIGTFFLSEATNSVVELNTISLSAFPNPAVNELNVTAIEDVVAVSVINLEGKVVVTASGSKVDVSNLNSGVYMYEATTVSGLKAVNKFVKL